MDCRNFLNLENKNAMKKCRVPYMNTQRCYENEFEPCPKFNGSYNQCTNNYYVDSGISKYRCAKQFYPEITPANLYVSDKCYFANYNPNLYIPFNKGNPTNMRVNLYHSQYPNPNPKLYKNGAVSY